jgi:NADH-quinone oxidoreductase subunit N
MSALVAQLAQPLLAQSETTPIETPEIVWSAVMPIVVLVAGGVLILTFASLLKEKVRPEWFGYATVAIALGAMGAAVPLWNEIQDPDRGPFTAIAGAIGVDGFSVFLTFVICGSVLLTALLAIDYLRAEGQDAAEVYALLLFSAAGGVIMASANDLIVMFMGLETLSLPVYVLAATQARRRSSQEAGMKYFVLGAFSSAFFLYGVALVYGATGSTNLADISEFLSQNVLLDNGLLLAGLGFLLVGFGFKISAVPFHQWAPDVYQGSPSPIVGYMAGGVKAAGFAGLLRVFYLGFDAYGTDWQPLIYALAVASLLGGAILALVQTDVKRMLAYSSINHAGFILVGVEANSALGVESVLFYLASYAAIVAGSFGVISVIGRATSGRHDLSAYRGLNKTNPVLALTFTVFLLAQAGVPFTSGFFAKFDVLAAAVDAGSYWLALVAMISAVISAFLYLRIVATMYVAAEEGEEVDPLLAGSDTAVITRSTVKVGAASALAIGIAVFITIEAGLLPWTFTDLAADAVPVLIAG